MNARNLMAGMTAGLTFFIITSIFNIGGVGYWASASFQVHTFGWHMQKLLYDLIIGITMALLYHFMEHSIPGQKWNRGFTYGFFVFLLADIPFFIFAVHYLSFMSYLAFVMLVGLFFARLIMGLEIALIVKEKHNRKDIF